jgi:uncharacterized tellurite resistance protein B-like protein
MFEVHVFEAIKSFVADLANSDGQSGGLGDDEFRVAYAALLVHAAAIDGAVSDADGAPSDYENNLIWRVADLLGVSQAERVALRQRAAATRSGPA